MTAPVPPRPAGRPCLAEALRHAARSLPLGDRPAPARAASWPEVERALVAISQRPRVWS